MKLFSAFMLLAIGIIIGMTFGLQLVVNLVQADAPYPEQYNLSPGK